MKSEATKKHKAIKCDVGKTTTKGISNVRKYLLLIYALSECNTNSAANEQGKLSVLKHLEKSCTGGGPCNGELIAADTDLLIMLMYV